MVYFLIFIFGLIIGILLSIIYYKRKTISGIVNIDHTNGLCKFQVANDLLQNKTKKSVIFIINHDAKIREENISYND